MIVPTDDGAVSRDGTGWFRDMEASRYHEAEYEHAEDPEAREYHRRERDAAAERDAAQVRDLFRPERPRSGRAARLANRHAANLAGLMTESETAGAERALALAAEIQHEHEALQEAQAAAEAVRAVRVSARVARRVDTRTTGRVRPRSRRVGRSGVRRRSGASSRTSSADPGSSDDGPPSPCSRAGRGGWSA